MQSNKQLCQDDEGSRNNGEAGEYLCLGLLGRQAIPDRRKAWWRLAAAGRIGAGQLGGVMDVVPTTR